VSVRRIRELLARAQVWSPHEAPRVLVELSEEVGTMLDSLDSRLEDLQSVLSAADLGPSSATIELVVRALADEFASIKRRESMVTIREGDPIVSWREMANVLAEGADNYALANWTVPAFRQVSSILRGEGFPCIFARQANYLKSGWVCFVDSIDTEEGRDLVKKAILAYYGVIKRYPRERTIIMPLLVLVKPVYPMLSLEQYRKQAWDLFQFLHDHDPEAWPIDVPTDPDLGDWSFCFGGIQLFSNVSCPAHKVHISRNLGDSLAFAMQPRTNFDLVGGNNKKGRLVRQEIRERAERYEGRPISKSLGFYGTPDNREWMQMATKDSEEDTTFPAQCPFHFTSKKGKPTE
jgi:FPC/CPF motif-containing protein YcgG